MSNQASKFKIGDKVKFLNTTGSGVVAKVENGLVYVTDETGFDLPMNPSELIRLAEMKGIARTFNPEGMRDIEPDDTRDFDDDKVLRSQLSAKNGQTYVPPTIEELEAENRRLRSQVASRDDVIRRLEAQIQSLQRTIARLS